MAKTKEELIKRVNEINVEISKLQQEGTEIVGVIKYLEEQEKEEQK